MQPLLLFLAIKSFLTLQPHELYSPPGSSVHGMFQARILEWVAVSFSRGSSWPRGQTCISCISSIIRQILFIASATWPLKATRSYKNPKPFMNGDIFESSQRDRKAEREGWGRHTCRMLWGESCQQAHENALAIHACLWKASPRGFGCQHSGSEAKSSLHSPTPN